MDGGELKVLEWIGSARKDLLALPLAVRRVFGYALYAVQLGVKPPEAKPLKGFGGAGVLELIEDFKGDTGRLHRSVCCQDICFACVSEKGQARYCNTRS